MIITVQEELGIHDSAASPVKTNKITPLCH